MLLFRTLNLFTLRVCWFQMYTFWSQKYFFHNIMFFSGALLLPTFSPKIRFRSQNPTGVRSIFEHHSCWPKHTCSQRGHSLFAYIPKQNTLSSQCYFCNLSLVPDQRSRTIPRTIKIIPSLNNFTTPASATVSISCTLFSSSSRLRQTSSYWVCCETHLQLLCLFNQP